MTLLETDFARQQGSLSQKLNQGFKAIMRNSLAPGKGVLEGMEVTAGPGLALTIGPGEYQAQVHDELGTAQVFPVPANYDGFLWVEANSDPGDIPAFDYQGTDADRGSDWVCLGHFKSTANSVAYDDAGRRLYGWRSRQGATQEQVLSVVSDLDLASKSDIPQWRVETVSGPVDGTNRVFTISRPPVPGSLRVQFDAKPGRIAFSNGGMTLTFDTAPPAGTIIEAQYSYLP